MIYKGLHKKDLNSRGYARDKLVPSPNLPKPAGGRRWITSDDSTHEHPLLWCDGCGSAFHMEKDKWFVVDAPSRIGVLCDECADADVDHAKSDGRLHERWPKHEVGERARDTVVGPDLGICEGNTHSDTYEVFERLYKR
jgi:hypothetical protein